MHKGNKIIFWKIHFSGSREVVEKNERILDPRRGGGGMKADSKEAEALSAAGAPEARAEGPAAEAPEGEWSGPASEAPEGGGGRPALGGSGGANPERETPSWKQKRKVENSNAAQYY